MFTLRNINMALTMSQCYGAEGEPTTRRVQKTFACPRPTASIFKITATNQKTGLVNAFNQASILCENYSSELCHCLLEVSMEPQYEKVGRITHFYSKPSVAVVELSTTLNKGDKIVIRGSNTHIEQTVESIEIEHKQLASAQGGQSIGMKVNGRVRENDIVYRVKPNA